MHIFRFLSIARRRDGDDRRSHRGARHPYGVHARLSSTHRKGEQLATLRCNGCGHEGPPEEFPPTMSPYHDFRCPKCGTTAINTSELNKEWAAQGKTYGYGDHNSPS